MRARAFWRLVRIRWRLWAVSREVRRRRELAAAVGPVSERWIKTAIYTRGTRREE
jgi:hypothetical protein